MSIKNASRFNVESSDLIILQLNNFNGTDSSYKFNEGFSFFIDNATVIFFRSVLPRYLLPIT